MTLIHSILTVLCDHPACGYDISRKLRRKSSYCWMASHQQVYLSLAKMESKGWITSESLPLHNPSKKKIFEITQLGRQELSDWHRQPTQPAPIREDLLVKVLNGSHLPTEDLIQVLHHQRQVHRDQLLYYQSLEIRYKHNIDHPSRTFYSYLTLRYSIRYEKGWIDWCDEVLDFLKKPRENSNVWEKGLSEVQK